MAKTKTSVLCAAYKVRETSPPQIIEFNLGTDLAIKVHGPVGPRGLSKKAADLVDVAASVFQIEHQLKGRQRTNPIGKFELLIRVRDASVWNKAAVATLIEILNELGNPTWSIQIKAGLKSRVPKHQKCTVGRIDRVALFSGGLDSACGALTLQKQSPTTQLTSYYTGQKSLQAHLAEQFGFSPPVQWSLEWGKSRGRGHSYFYRSFLFLALGAAVADSWGIKRILQFENGVLASAIPPAPSFAMTHHAHPKLHSSCARLFGHLFGGKWDVTNPFLPYTKRGCIEAAVKHSSIKNVDFLLAETQTCWFFRSNRIPGGSKRPGVGCGVCIPCVLRRTAKLNDRFSYDLTKDSDRNNRIRGTAFRSYYGFLSRTLGCRDEAEFYRFLPAPGRDVVASGVMKLADLYRLFQQFGHEFMDTYGVTPVS